MIILAGSSCHVTASDAQHTLHVLRNMADVERPVLVGAAVRQAAGRKAGRKPQGTLQNRIFLLGWHSAAGSKLLRMSEGDLVALMWGAGLGWASPHWTFLPT